MSLRILLRCVERPDLGRPGFLNGALLGGHQEPEVGCIGRSLGLRVLLLAVALLLPLAASGDQAICGPDGSQSFDTAHFHRGVGTVQLTEEGVLQLMLASAAREAENKLFRIAFYPQATPRVEALAARGAQGSLTILDRQADFYHELEVYFDADESAVLTFFVDQRDCVLSGAQLRSYLDQGVYPAAAIAQRSVPASMDLQSRELQQILAAPLILPDDEVEARSGSEALTLAPLWCQSGGPGALSCGISLGGIGPVDFGGCEVSCPPPAYACCGQGLGGANCTCIGSGSGGWDWVPPWWPSPPDDDDDDSGDEDPL